MGLFHFGDACSASKSGAPVDIQDCKAAGATRQECDLMVVLLDKWDALMDAAVLAAVSGSHVLFLDALESPHAIRHTAQLGKLVPLQGSVTGRVPRSRRCHLNTARPSCARQHSSVTPRTRF